MGRTDLNLNGKSIPEWRGRYFWWVTLGSILALGGFAIWQYSEPLSMHAWSVEDGPIENGTALIYFMAACVFLLAAFKNNISVPDRVNWGRTFLVIWALGSIVIAGEEISWGQRIFGFDTPQAIAEINFQQEANFHNLDIFADGRSRFPVTLHAAFMAGIGVFFPMIALTSWGQALFQRFRFPVMPMAYATLIVGAALYGKILRVDALYPKDPTEVRELLWAIAIFAFSVQAYVTPWEVYRLQKLRSGQRIASSKLAVPYPETPAFR